MVVIAITGTPGTGKTAISKIVAKTTDAMLISLNSFIKKRKLSECYDRKRKAMVVNPDRIRKSLKKEIGRNKKNKDFIIDSHLSHLMEPDIIFVLRLDPKVLEKRLRKRKYPKNKIKENVQAEILDVIYAEAMQSRRKVIQINATGMKPEQISKRILNTLRSKKYRSDKVDWTRKYGEYLS